MSTKEKRKPRASDLPHEFVPCADDGEKFERVKIIVLGDAGVGKTSLLIRFSDRKFDGERWSTIGVDYVSVKIMTNHPTYDRPTLAQVWDSAGQERFSNVVQMYMRGAHGAMMVFDSTRPETFVRCSRERDRLREMVPDCVCAIVANKADLYNSPNSNAPRWMEKRDFAREAKELDCSAGFFECSAADGSGVDAALVKLIDMALARKREINGMFSANESQYASGDGVVQILNSSQVNNSRYLSVKCCGK